MINEHHNRYDARQPVRESFPAGHGRDASQIRDISIVPTQLANQQGERATRSLPEGVAISTTEGKDGWKEESGNRLTKLLRLQATIDTKPCGKLIAEARIQLNPDNEEQEVDRYVYLSSMYVPNGKDNLTDFPEYQAIKDQNMRNRGIGSSLLTELEDQAISFGATRIEGRVIQADINSTDGLLDFYRRRGFEVLPDEDMFRIVKQLEFRTNVADAVLPTKAQLQVTEPEIQQQPSLMPFPPLASPVPEIPTSFWKKDTARHDLDQRTLFVAERIGPYQTDPTDLNRLEETGAHAYVVGAQTAGGENLALKIGKSSHPIAHEVFSREAFFHNKAHQLSDLVPELLDAGTLILQDVYGEEQAYPVLVFRAVNGRTLNQSYTSFTIPEVEEYFTPLAESLDAFGAEIVHRDLNPNNILLEDAVARPVDFGLAAPVGTVTDIPLGAPNYRSLEQWTRGSQVTADTNTYQFAKVIEEITDYNPKDQAAFSRAFADDPTKRPSATEFVSELVAAHKQANATVIPLYYNGR